jgi:hypothetical protein
MPTPAGIHYHDRADPLRAHQFGNLCQRKLRVAGDRRALHERAQRTGECLLLAGEPAIQGAALL